VENGRWCESLRRCGRVGTAGAAYWVGRFDWGLGSGRRGVARSRDRPQQQVSARAI